MADTSNKPIHNQRFSFTAPATFKYGSDTQKATLHTIAQSEFNLEHLETADRELLEEALRFSGVEVHNSCVIDEHTSGRLRAFIGKWTPDRHVRYHPTNGISELVVNFGTEQHVIEWKKTLGETSEYPYPFSEAQVLPKLIPVDLSSIQLLSRTTKTAIFSALPSRLLTTHVAEDNIVEREQLAVEFEVDLGSKRVTTLSLYLPKPVTVVTGISLRELNLTYKFESIEVANTNVLVSMEQQLKGRIWLLFRPRLSVETKLSYVECIRDVPDESYLYESIRAISALDLESPQED